MEDIGNNGNVLFIKESKANGNRCYIAEYEKIQRNTPQTGYPQYYNDIAKEKTYGLK